MGLTSSDSLLDKARDLSTLLLAAGHALGRRRERQRCAHALQRRQPGGPPGSRALRGAQRHDLLPLSALPLVPALSAAVIHMRCVILSRYPALTWPMRAAFQTGGPVSSSRFPTCICPVHDRNKVQGHVSTLRYLGSPRHTPGAQQAVFTAEPQSLRQKVLPTGRTPSSLLLEPGKPATGVFLRAAVLPGAAEHVREAGEDMTNGRTLLGRFCREHCQQGSPLGRASKFQLQMCHCSTHS